VARKERIRIHDVWGVKVVSLGQVEIWDGADMALLRDTLSRLFYEEGCRSIGVDLTHVKYIPSGFFGMLDDYHRKGAEVRLYSPQPRVRQMLWFRQFFDLESTGCYRMRLEPKHPMLPLIASATGAEPPWKTTADGGLRVGQENSAAAFRA